MYRPEGMRLLALDMLLCGFVAVADASLNGGLVGVRPSCVVRWYLLGLLGDLVYSLSVA